MSVDKLVDSTQLDLDLTSVANAIRTKGGTSASLTFPSDFVSAINAISGGGTGQTATGTVTGDGTSVLEIPCDFEPDLIYVYGDMSGDVANRGIISLTIIKDASIYVGADTSTSSIQENVTSIHGITGYNESDASNTHATYLNGTLTIDTMSNTSSGKWRSGQVYNYELSTIGTGGGGSGYTRTVVVPEQTVTPAYHSDDNTNGYSAQLNNVTEMFEQWSEYIVTFNSTEYYFTTLLLWGSNYLFGEQAYLWSGTSGTTYPYPFCVISTSVNDSYIYTASTDSVTVKIEKLELTGSGGGGGSYTWETKSEQDINITTDGTYNYAIWTYTEPLQANETYRITWGENGTEYICKTVKDISGSSLVYDGYYLGNASLVSEGEDTGEPFLIYRNNSTRMVVTTTQSTGSWHVKVEKQVQISATLTPNLQSKSATPTTSSQTISPDNGYDGLSSVTVGAIPSQYIVPTGNKAITENGTGIDVTQYATVSVSVSGSSMNVQTSQSTTRRNKTALGSITSLTCSKAGTYDVYWSCARSSTSGTWGSQLYINGTAYGTENTTFSNHAQNNHLTGVTIPANATVAVYGRSRSGYYIYVPQLTIVQTT